MDRGWGNAITAPRLSLNAIHHVTGGKGIMPCKMVTLKWKSINICIAKEQLMSSIDKAMQLMDLQHSLNKMDQDVCEFY
jgi:hypothetical protein